MNSDDTYLSNMHGVFEPYTAALLNTLIKPGDVALDVGANIGCTALLLGQTVSKVIAFEPGRRTFAMLVRNIEQSGMTNIHAVNAGLGSKDAEFDLMFNPANRSGGVVLRGDAGKGQVGHERERIQILNGDDYIRKSLIDRIDFIKIDVEGFEQDVVTGFSETISKHRPVVILELNHWCLNAFQRCSVPQYFDFLRSIFPVLYAFHVDEVKNLHDPQESFQVMSEHILTFKYMSIVAAFDTTQIEDFIQIYVRRSGRYIQLEQQHETDKKEIAELRDSGHALRSQVSDLIESDAALRSQIAEMSKAAETLQNRISWRLTAPLRAVRRWM